MEPAMISLKVLSAAAALALALPAVAPTESLAQVPPHRGPGGRPVGAPVAGARPAGAPVVAGVPVPGTGSRVYGGGAGRYDFDRERHHHDRGFIPGAVAGALIGGAIASQGPYYASTPYYAGSPSYYYGGDDYNDGPVVQVAPDTGGDDVAYCMQTYRSYDPQSGTYLGLDGYRHPCP
jgi:hypothetical protein